MSRPSSSFALAVTLSLLVHGVVLLWPMRSPAVSLQDMLRPSLAVQLRPAATQRPAVSPAAVTRPAPPASRPAVEASRPPVSRPSARQPAPVVPAVPVPAPVAPVVSPLPAATSAAAPAPAVPAGSAAPPGVAPVPTGPLRLAGDLAVVCASRPAPAYPALSRRLGETGKVVVRVLLDSEGRVAEATIEQSSAYTRLDEAALAAVRQWRCTPAQRAGQAVAATALQPFSFVLDGQ